MKHNNILDFEKFKRRSAEPEVQLEDEKEEDEALDPVTLVALLEFLTDLRKGKPFNRPSDQNIELRRQGIKDVSDGWLFARINRSTASDWKRHPTFYDAVIAELMGRGKIPKRK